MDDRIRAVAGDEDLAGMGEGGGIEAREGRLVQDGRLREEAHEHKGSPEEDGHEQHGAALEASGVAVTPALLVGEDIDTCDALNALGHVVVHGREPRVVGLDGLVHRLDVAAHASEATSDTCSDAWEVS
jgi:hypothetical protein